MQLKAQNQDSRNKGMSTKRKLISVLIKMNIMTHLHLMTKTQLLIQNLNRIYNKKKKFNKIRQIYIKNSLLALLTVQTTKKKTRYFTKKI